MNKLTVSQKALNVLKRKAAETTPFQIVGDRMLKDSFVSAQMRTGE